MLLYKKALIVGSLCLTSFVFGFTSSDVISSTTNDISVADGTTKTDDAFAGRSNSLECGCVNGGACKAGEFGNVCQCRNGTSGDNCQIVDECVRTAYPKCGTEPEVKCVYNISKEAAECKCSNAIKAFDSHKKSCKIPCKTDQDCAKEYIDCVEDEETGVEFCRCPFRLGGDRCTVRIDECKAAGLDCGINPNVTCEENSTKQAVCYCRDWSEGFNYEVKDCIKCECGRNNLGCQFFPGGEKMCYCNQHFYQTEDGKCEDCDCGFVYKGCKLENGIKRCECYVPYLENNGTCEKCECGKNSDGCTFKNGEKVCSCHNNYLQSNGTCKKRCYEWSSSACKNGGKCVGSVCQCLPGTKGDECEIVEGCEYSWEVSMKCGYYDDVSCKFNQTSGESYCACKDRSDLFDTDSKICKECDCGPDGSCRFVKGRKTCDCKDGYTLRPSSYWTGNSKCEKCDCGVYSSGCKFESYNKKECSCKSGYEQKYNECAECDCGPHGVCSFDDDGKKVCRCQKGFSVRDGECVECDCGSRGECVWDESGMKSCNCPQGYGIKYGECEKCTCYLRGEIGVNCTFTYGYQECICPPGYKESTSNFCLDIDECRDSSVCPSNTQCINTEGSYKCICKKGYKPYDEIYDPMTYGCQDINECEEQNDCPFRDTTQCINTVGNYFCVCKPGYTQTLLADIETIGCEENQVGWKVGYGILIVVFGIVSAVLILMIWKKRASS